MRHPSSHSSSSAGGHAVASKPIRNSSVAARKSGRGQSMLTTGLPSRSSVICAGSDHARVVRHDAAPAASAHARGCRTGTAGALVHALGARHCSCSHDDVLLLSSWSGRRRVFRAPARSRSSCSVPSQAGGSSCRSPGVATPPVHDAAMPGCSIHWLQHQHERLVIPARPLRTQRREAGAISGSSTTPDTREARTETPTGTTRGRC